MQFRATMGLLFALVSIVFFAVMVSGCKGNDEGISLEEASKPQASANPDVPTPPKEGGKFEDDPKKMKGKY